MGCSIASHLDLPSPSSSTPEECVKKRNKDHVLHPRSLAGSRTQLGSDTAAPWEGRHVLIDWSCRCERER